MLPAYMVPQQVHTVEAMPLTASGKVDRQSLLAAATSAPEIPRGKRRLQLRQAVAGAVKALGAEVDWSASLGSLGAWASKSSDSDR
ncbi:unnamed protein product [Effrenium voratum]|nr:unnamed protein product [Effrenium voratum]